jgi:hypothetical protein
MYNKSGDERASMGKAGRALVQEKYDEKVVIESYFRSIEALSANITYPLSS